MEVFHTMSYERKKATGSRMKLPHSRERDDHSCGLFKSEETLHAKKFVSCENGQCGENLPFHQI